MLRCTTPTALSWRKLRGLEKPTLDAFPPQQDAHGCHAEPAARGEQLQEKHPGVLGDEELGLGSPAARMLVPATYLKMLIAQIANV